MIKWINVESNLPVRGQNVLATYLNNLGNRRVIKAFYAVKYGIENSTETDYYDEDDNGDTYLPQGWYESIDNWDEYSSVFVNEGTITHWMELPSTDGLNYD